MRRLHLLTAAVLVISCSSVIHAANWPQWRGPSLDGSSPETGLPAEFGPNQNIAWSAELPGRGGATPIVWGSRVFISAQDEDETTYALALSAEDGRILWKHRVGNGSTNSRGQTACTPSPVTDGERVYFLYSNGDLLAFDMDGEKLWGRDLHEDHGEWEIRWGYGSSPLLWRGNLYITVIHGDYRKKAPEQARSYLLCVDPETGEDRWKHMRPSPADWEAKQAYSTPIPLDRGNTQQLIVAGGEHVTGHDPSTGRELWRSPTFNPRDMKYFPLVASPVVADGKVLICAPRGSNLYGIRYGSSEWAWRQKRRAGFSPTPAAYRGRVYVLDDQRRRLLLVEPKTGKIIDECELPGRGALHPSPSAADGKIYCIDGRGRVMVVSAEKPLEVLHTAQFEGRKVRSTITISGGRLFIRVNDTLHCIEGQ